MTRNVTVVRYNDKIEETLAKLDELKERFANVGLSDRGKALVATLTQTVPVTLDSI